MRTPTTTVWIRTVMVFSELTSRLGSTYWTLRTYTSNNSTSSMMSFSRSTAYVGIVKQELALVAHQAVVHLDGGLIGLVGDVDQARRSIVLVVRDQHVSLAHVVSSLKGPAEEPGKRAGGDEPEEGTRAE